MDSERRLRKLPPIVISVIAALALSAAAFISISRNTTMQVTADGHPREQTQQATITATSITTQTTTAEPEPTYISMVKSRDWDAEDSKILLKIAMAEAEGESTEGKALVMLVVLNRVWSDQFPGTIEEVVFEPKQFSPVMEGGRYYTTEPDEDCYKALEMVMHGWDESYGALYFESCEGSSWHSEHLEFLYQVGNHKFYR